MDALLDVFLARYVYFMVLVLLAIGLYGVLVKGDLVKKVIGLTIFSTAIYLFFIEGSLQDGGTAPVIDARGSDPALYVDPLPHLLILTAIVVGVGVVGVALALLVRLHRTHGTLDEAVIVARLAGRELAPWEMPDAEYDTATGQADLDGNGDGAPDGPAGEAEGGA